MHPDTHSLDLFGILWRLGATLFFVVLNGFFVAAEFSLVKVRKARINELATQGARQAKTVKHILSHLDLYLSSCQLGITLSSLVLGALGEPAVSVLLIAGAESAGISLEENARWLPFVSIGLSFAVITILHMTLGEQAPKMFALRRPEVTSLGTSSILRGFTFIFRPFILLINVVSNWMLRLVGLPADEHGDSVPTAEEIRSILSLSARAGEISDQQLEITQNVFRLIELEVRHIMVPRVDAEFLSLDDTLEENLALIKGSSHSRFPLCERGLDTVVGFVHGKDVLERMLDGGDVDLRNLGREPLLVPDTMALSDLLVAMQEKRVHLAAVVDEHGTVVGLAFREDALEEIVGPLGDEFDDEAPEFHPVGEDVYEVRGRMAFPDLCARLEIDVDDDEGEETVAGWITAQLGRMPGVGDELSIAGWHIRVETLEGRRIEKLRFTRATVAEARED